MDHQNKQQVDGQTRNMQPVTIRYRPGYPRQKYLGILHGAIRDIKNGLLRDIEREGGSQ
jgi:hypothetical protein